MRRALKVGLVAFVVALPLLMAPTSGGIPSRPRFQAVTVTGTVTAATVNATSALQLNGTPLAAGFQGATARRTTAFTGLSSAGTLTAVPLDAEITDTGNYHDNVTLNTRVLLPTQTGFAQCSANFTGATATTVGATASETRTYICINGAGLCVGNQVVASETPLYDDGGTAGGTFLPTWRTSMVTPVLPVAGGDYAEFFVFFSGYSANTNRVNTDTGNSNSQSRLSCWAVK